MNKLLNKKNLAALVLVVVMAGWVFFYGSSVTGQVTNIPVQQPVTQPALPQPVAQPVQNTVQTTQAQICEGKSAGLTGSAKTDFLASCTSYYNKLCFSNSDCGPFSCLSNKCQ